jgi:molybdenum cofactor guanylyltransferase
VSYPETIGIVLAGGRARRMGGGDKANIRIGGPTILERVVARLAPQCSRLILSANSDPARFADTGLTVVPDSMPDYAGPLAGILAGLDWVAEHAPQTAWVVSAPNDCPFLPRALVERLHQARLASDASLACASSGGRRHPVIALWPVGLRDDLRAALVKEGLRKVEQWAARYTVGIADWPAAPIDPFFNVNTPEDAAEAARIAAQHPEA